MTGEFHIASLLVSTIPRRVHEVGESLGAVPCAAIDRIDAGRGKIIVIMETDSEDDIVRALTDIQLLDGVVSVAMVYHHVGGNGPTEPAQTRMPPTTGNTGDISCQS